MFRSPLPDVDIPDVTVHEFLFGSLSEADRGALVDGPTGETTTYRELEHRIDAVAGALAARGILPGDVVALHSANSVAFVVVFHAILRAGATATTVNAMATASDLAAQLADSGAGTLFTTRSLLSQANTAAATVGIPEERVIVIDGATGHSSLDDFLGERLAAPAVTVDPARHLAVLPYSSGTTARPKGVMLTHRNLVANVVQCADLVGVADTDRVLAVLPLFHIYGMTALLHVALARRATVVTMPRFDLPEFLRTIQDESCTYVFIAPPIALALAKHPLVDAYDLSSVRTMMSGAAALDGAVAASVAQRIGCRMRQGYGMTEMSPVSHLIPHDRDDIPLSGVGITVPNMECKLIDTTTGAEIPVPADGVSEPGELLCKGPNVMVGYLGNAEATSESIDDDGFLHTGDIATVDANGLLTVVDRLKELIKYKGYQVAPAELEAVLVSHPRIADAAVIAGRDTDGEEIPKAFVVLQPECELDAADIIAFVAERVAPHKKIREVALIDAIPKSAAGKILRKDLRAVEVMA